MEYLKLGSKGRDMDLLCQYLGVTSREVFDSGLDKIVKAYQESHGLKVDGEVGYNTWKSLVLSEREKSHKSDKVTSWDYEMFGKLLGCEAACLKAVQKVETGGRGGFLENGKPQILFEGHVFWKELENVGLNPKELSKKYPGIVYQKWDKSKYSGGVGEWTRLIVAEGIHQEAALKSASWGMFQIMGNNYSLCGCKDIHEFYQGMCKNEFTQFILGLEFMKKGDMIKYLIKKDWSGFARSYNGPGYRSNNYDIKLEQAYKHEK